MKLKKILFILHLPPPIHGASVMGKYIHDSSLINEAFNSEFINLTTSKTIDEIGKNPIFKIGRYLQIFFSVIYRLLIFNPDKVYITITANGLGFYKDFPIALLVKLFRKKLVLHYHNKGVKPCQNIFFYNILYKVLFNNVKVILLSEYLYDDVKKYVKVEDVYFCPNGIPSVEFVKSDIKHNKPIELLFLSNLIESKGIFILLESLKILKDKHINFHCNLVGGEGDITNYSLMLKLEELNLNNEVSFLGKKYGHNKNSIYKKSDIFVFPTFYQNECFPLVILEAMMFGLPVISTNEGGIPDIVKDHETGYVVEKKSSMQLAQKIEYLIQYPNEALRMGEYGRRQFLEKYTLNRFEERLIEILKSQ